MSLIRKIVAGIFLVDGLVTIGFFVYLKYFAWNQVYLIGNNIIYTTLLFVGLKTLLFSAFILKDGD